MSRRGHAGLLIVLIVLISSMATASAQEPGSTTTIVGSPDDDGQQQQQASSAVIGTTIVCTLKIANPHNSRHVPGTVDVVPVVKCTAPVAEIRILTVLHRNGVLVRQLTTTRAGTSTLKGPAGVPCVPGNYYGAALATVIFPPGYSPASGSGLVGSNTVPITC